MRKVVPRLCSQKEQIPSSPEIHAAIVHMCVAQNWVGRGNLLPGLVPSALLVSINQVLFSPNKLRSNSVWRNGCSTEQGKQYRAQSLHLHLRGGKPKIFHSQGLDQFCLLTFQAAEAGVFLSMSLYGIFKSLEEGSYCHKKMFHDCFWGNCCKKS